VVFVLVESRLTSPMFDLGLLRIPTFNGGLVAAWGVSASIFAMLTYLVIYLQNVLGYSALQTGVRFLPLSGAIFVVAAICRPPVVGGYRCAGSSRPDSCWSESACC